MMDKTDKKPLYHDKSEYDGKNSVSCPICCSVFTDKASTPRLLQCGHTLCQTCLKKMKKDSVIECPYDRQLTPVMHDSVSSLKKNFALINICFEHPQTVFGNNRDESTLALFDSRYETNTTETDVERQSEHQSHCFSCKPNTDHQERAIHAFGLMFLMGNLFFDWFVNSHVNKIAVMQEPGHVWDYSSDIPSLKKLNIVHLNWYIIHILFLMLAILTTVFFGIQFFGTMLSWCFTDSNKMPLQKIFVWASMVFNDLPQCVLTTVLTYSTDDQYLPYLGSIILGVAGNILIFYALSRTNTLHYPRMMCVLILVAFVCFIIQVAHITKAHMA